MAGLEGSAGLCYHSLRHTFDTLGQNVMRLPNVDSAAECTPPLASMRGPILNLFALRKCIKKGAPVGWNPEVTDAARRNVRTQLADLLK